MIKSCVLCSKEFDGARQARYCPNCRASRHGGAVNKAYRQELKNRVVGGGICGLCGKTFEKTSRNQTKCWDCKKNVSTYDDSKKRYYQKKSDHIKQYTVVVSKEIAAEFEEKIKNSGSNIADTFREIIREFIEKQ